MTPVLFHMTLFFSICLVPFLSSQEAAEDDRVKMARRATLFYEAQKYAQARVMYQQLLQNTQEPWEKALLQYNLGCVFLAEGLWTQAIQEFDAIDLEHDPYPRLARSVYINKAIALLESVQDQYENKLPTAQHPQDLLQEMLMQLDKAVSALNASSLFDCEWAQLEPGHSCSTALDISEIRDTTKQMITNLQHEAEYYQIQKMPTIEIIAHLTASLKSDSHEIPPLPHTTTAEYLANREANRKPYWDALQQRPEPFSHIKTALSQYKTAITSLNRENISTSRLDLIQVLAETAFAPYAHKTPAIQQLARLRFAYAETLAEPLQKEQVNSLSNALAAVKTMTATSQPLLQASQQQSASWAALNQGDTATARLFLTMAVFWIDRALQASLSEGIATPVSRIDNAIEIEQFAKQAAFDATTLPLRELQTEAQQNRLFGLLLQSQESALLAADAFISEVLLTEKQQYIQGKCQKTPWDRALPLFFDGAEAAKQAARGLKNKDSFTTVLPQQTRAYESWTAVREQLIAGEATQAAPIGAEEPTKRDKQLHFQETVRLLQQMEIDDKPQSKSGSTKPGILRPW